MFIKSLLLCATLLQFLELSKSHVLNKNVTQTDCEKICMTSGGQSEFNEETKLCQCKLLKTIDETDIALIHKNANVMSKNLSSVATVNGDTIIIKREVSTTEKPETTEAAEILAIGTTVPTQISPETTTTKVKITTTPKEDEVNFSFEEMVGQQPPQRRLPHQRLVTQKRPRESRPITQDQQRIVLQQIRDHLNRLSQVSDQRVREMEIDAIKNNLRQLSNTSLIQTPQQRSRVRNVVEEARKRRIQHRLVGAAGPESSTVKHENDVEIQIKDMLHGKKRHFEVITQDPTLIDE